MRIRHPKPGPLDHRKTPAQPGGGAARSDIEAGQTTTGSALSHTPKAHRALTELARILGRQFAREATRKGGGHE